MRIKPLQATPEQGDRARHGWHGSPGAPERRCSASADRDLSLKMLVRVGESPRRHPTD
jgi:hypothetical protein